MPVIPTAEQQGPTSVRYEWTGDAPFNVWMNGDRVLVDSSETHFIAQFAATEAPYAIEVLDSNDSAPAQSQDHSPRARIQWRGSSDTAYYVIEKYDGVNWNPVQIVIESGRGYYAFTAPPDRDGETVQYRVRGYDESGYVSPVLAFTHHVVCNPQPPTIAFSYAAGDLTVALP